MAFEKINNTFFFLFSVFFLCIIYFLLEGIPP